VTIVKRERFLGGRKVEIDEEERVVSDLPEGVVCNPAFLVLRRALSKAIVQHAQRCLELARENRFYIFNHGDLMLMPQKGQARSGTSVNSAITAAGRTI
jgi:hypothetical protein